MFFDDEWSEFEPSPKAGSSSSRAPRQKRKSGKKWTYTVENLTVPMLDDGDMAGIQNSRRSLHRKLTYPHAALAIPGAFSNSQRPSRQLSVQFTDDTYENGAKPDLPWLFVVDVPRPEEKCESPLPRRGDVLARSPGLNRREKMGQGIGLELLRNAGIKIDESTLAKLGVKDEDFTKWNKEGYIQEVITRIIDCDKDVSQEKGPGRPKSWVRKSN